MTDTEDTALAAWPWWERRRPLYNVVLAITGWAGFALMIVVGFSGDLRALGSLHLPDLFFLILRLGLVYLVYMAAANLLFLLGPALEALLRPDPVGAYRKRALAMGMVVSTALPLLAALSLGLAIWDPGHGG